MVVLSVVMVRVYHVVNGVSSVDGEWCIIW